MVLKYQMFLSINLVLKRLVKKVVCSPRRQHGRIGGSREILDKTVDLAEWLHVANCSGGCNAETQ
jgi:hypothetical protein